MSDTPEMDRLTDRLCSDPRRRLRNFHVTLGDGSFNTEQLCAAVNRALDAVDRADEIIADAEVEAGAEALAERFFLIRTGDQWPLKRFPATQQQDFRDKARAVLLAAWRVRHGQSA